MRKALFGFAILLFAVAAAHSQAARPGALPAVQQDTPAGAPWRFAVSGDSRNCGDVVMPAIAAGVVTTEAP